MKRKGIFTGAIATLTVICVIVVTGISVQADARAIKSRGNFVLGSGEMSIHASDIDYLQSEVQTLYSELPSILEINASGTGTARRDNLRSKGIINYKNGAAILDSSDLTLLADEIDNLESEYKANTVAALNDINTYFKIDSSVTHEQGESLSSTYANNLSFDGICNGILQSQSVDHLQATPIIADNLTAGTAAWVNGTCIIGNGADNERAYKKGKEDGEDGDGEDIDMDYSYHIHRDGTGEEVTKDKERVYASSDPGGCYVPAGHTHNQTGSCPKVERMVTMESKTEYTRENGTKFWRAKYKCNHCGKTWTSSEYEESSSVPETQPCPDEPHYICGKATNTWKIGCGKENGDIESVVITIRKKVKE